MQLLKIPREERAGFRRQLKALAADGELIEVRGNRYGVAEKMDLVVGRLQPHAGGFGFVVPERRADPGEPDIFVAAPQPEGGDARRSRRRARRALSRRATAPKAASSASSNARTPRLVGRFDAGGRRARVRRRRSTSGCTADVAIPSGDAAGRKAGDMVTVEITRWPTATRGPIGRVTEVLGRHRRSGRRHDDHHPEVRPAGRARRRKPSPRRAGCSRGGAPRAPCTRAEGPVGRTDFRERRHRHDRRRARARLRRRDFDRAAAERPLLARRAHRRRVALRARRAAPSTPRRTSAARRCISPSARCTCSRRSWPPASAA